MIYDSPYSNTISVIGKFLYAWGKTKSGVVSQPKIAIVAIVI